MENITIIVPLHEYNETVQAYLAKAMASVDRTQHDVIFVGPKEVIEKASAQYENIALVENKENTDFFTQINKAVYKVVTKYFSILEFDDQYLPNWDKVFSTEELTGRSIVIPFDEFYTNKDGEEKFASFANELAWDVAFIEQDGELGVITESELTAYKDFNVTGGVIKTEDFISLGGFKPEYKIISWFEFLMRAIRAGKVLYVVPRVCYRHTVLREDSYASKAEEIMPQDEFVEKLKTIVKTDDEVND